MLVGTHADKWDVSEEDYEEVRKSLLQELICLLPGDQDFAGMSYILPNMVIY